MAKSGKSPLKGGKSPFPPKMAKKGKAGKMPMKMPKGKGC